MFDFEKLHPNHKFAFLDGFLCGLVIAYMANGFYKDYKEARVRKAVVETTTPSVLRDPK